MNGPVHPEMARQLQHIRRDELVRALPGCRRTTDRRERRRR
jgi:hypothetical protein